MFTACYKRMKSAAFWRMDGKFICIYRFCDPSVIQLGPFGLPNWREGYALGVCHGA